MVVSVWFGLILLILFTAGIIDEWKKGGSANRMSATEKDKYLKRVRREAKEDIKNNIRGIQDDTRGFIKFIKDNPLW